MALQAFLKATARLIQSDEDLPVEAGARAFALLKEFPELSICEAEDLSRLPHEALWIYRRSIFGIERSILENRLPRTIRTLRVAWEAHYGEPFDLGALIKHSQIESCWEGYLTTGLMESFEAALIKLHPALLASDRRVLELLRYERAIYEVNRAPELKVPPGSSEPNVVRTASVGQIIDSKIVVHSGGQSLHVNAEEFGAGKVFWIFRAADFSIQKVEVDADFATLLKERLGRECLVMEYLDSEHEARLKTLLTLVLSGAASIWLKTGA